MIKYITRIAIILIALPMLATVTPARADTLITLADPARPVDAALSTAVLQVLSANPPAPVSLYGITYVQPAGQDYIVSIVGLADGTPAAGWTLEDGAGVWFGSYVISLDGTGFRYPGRGTSVTPLQILGNIFTGFAALPNAAAGGGPEIQFPFATGYKAYYGVRGVHGSGDYGSSGLLAVDFVGGDTLGAGVMPAAVYAAAAGEIDYICDDGISIAAGVTDGGGNDFIYAHLIDNESLFIGATFNKGQYMGGLVRGSFNDTCGWASQQATNYHLHWMFRPANGYYQSEGCILNTSSGAWDCNDTTVTVGGWLYSTGSTYGAISNLEDDPISQAGGPGGPGAGGGSFFDQLIGGVYDVLNATIGQTLPLASTGGAGQTPTGLMVSTMKDYIMFISPVTYYLLGGSVNMTVIFMTLTIIMTFELLRFMLYIFRFIKLYFPGA